MAFYGDERPTDLLVMRENEWRIPMLHPCRGERKPLLERRGSLAILAGLDPVTRGVENRYTLLPNSLALIGGSGIN